MTHLARPAFRPLLRLLGTTALVPVALALWPPAAVAQTSQTQTQSGDAAGSANGNGTTVLPTVSVQGASQNPLGPVDGYVATRNLTGSKTDTPLIEVPQSVSVVTRDAIDQRQAQNLGEALRYSAGIRPEQYGFDSRADWLQIRGFEATDTSQFLNGLRFNPGYTAGVFETYGLERYEILRGPSSVLYGQMAPGGLINMVQRHPTDTAQGEVRLTAGTQNIRQLAFNTSGPLTADGQWSYALTGVGRLADLDVQNSNNDRLFVAPALTWKPTGDTRFTLLPYYQRDRTIGAQFLPYLGTVQRSAFGRISRSLNIGEDGFDKYDRTQYGIGYEFEHRFNDVFSFSQNARYAHVGVNWKQVYGGGLVAGSERLLNRYAYDEQYSFDTFQVDNRGQARFDTGPLQHTVLGGFDYQHTSYKSVAAFAVASPLDLYAPVYGSGIPTLGSPYQNRLQGIDQYGLYGQDQIRYGRFVATLGVRHDWVDTNTKNRAFGFTSESKEDTDTTWRAGITYLAENGLAPYFSYSTSFLPQAGGFSPARGNGTFDPTTGEQYEVGIKYQPNGLNSFVQVSAFHITQSQVLTADPDNALYQVQTGRIRVRGVEAEGVASLGNGLNLIGSITYLDPEITRDTVASNVGNRPLGVSKFTAGLYADYSFGEGRGAMSGVGLGAGVRFVGNTAVDNANSAVVPSVTLFDLAARYDLGQLAPNLKGFQALLNINNVADKRYVARCTSEASCFYGNSRTILGSLAYRW
ncbi:methicillin resistance protein FmtA [Roseomonas gilardii]|uniref:Methicillin resistance protein FmtA n=1 Tax=Roseomonas gilardii TaxID=257708 RepID=A0A1L7AHN7_9PROT|nr:TonB-dependent siderophore receptor [Roseomonas gilardii]APT58316.1 methicillin resistance protein FmtA [Roseomonas gilardii]